MLKGKTVLITGSNRGIGYSILETFSKNGANIIACLRKPNNKLENEFNNISKKYNNDIKIFCFDLNNENEVLKGSQEILNLNQNIDVLVNNAGINNVALFQMTPIKKIREVFEINLFSHMILTQKIIKNMIKNKKGSIINISSNAATECDVGRSAYASSKSALISFTKVLSKELGPYNIRTNAIAPGLTNTNMMDKDISKKIIEETIKKIPLKRPGTPEEISNVALFLASDLSSYINGETIYVTGGY